MGLFGGKDDTKAKIEELKAKMQGGQQPPQQGWQPPQQPWQQQQPQQHYQPPQQPPQQQAWQPPEQELPRQREQPMRHEHRRDEFEDADEVGIVLDLGEGMSLNLPIRSHMRLDEFLRIADRVRELKKIEQPQQRY